MGEEQVKMSCVTLQALMLTGHASSHTDWFNSDDWLVITVFATSKKELDINRDPGSRKPKIPSLRAARLLFLDTIYVPWPL